MLGVLFLFSLLSFCWSKCCPRYADVTARQLIIDLTTAVNDGNLALLNGCIAAEEAKVNSLAYDPRTNKCSIVSMPFPIFSASAVTFPEKFTNVTISNVSIVPGGNVLVDVRTLDTRKEWISHLFEFTDVLGSCDYRLIRQTTEEERCRRAPSPPSHVCACPKQDE